MDIIELELQNGKFFSPTNGELLFDPKTGVNEDASTLAGWWDDDIHQPYYEPLIPHEGMRYKWEDYINDIMLSNKELELEPNPEDFILKYQDDTTLLGFQIKLTDRKRAAGWIVVKMPGNAGIF